MKKIGIMMKVFYVFLIGVVSAFFISCGKAEPEDCISYPVIYDNANILSQEESNYLQKVNILGADITIYTIDSLNIDNFDQYKIDIRNEIYAKQGTNNKKDKIIIIASKIPNYTFITYDESYSKIPICKNGYASREYFLNQINDSISSYKKISETLRMAMNSYLCGEETINIVKNTVIDYFYQFSIPNNTWFYRHVTHPLQKIFQFIEKLFGFWIGTLLVCLFLYLLSLYISNYTDSKFDTKLFKQVFFYHKKDLKYWLLFISKGIVNKAVTIIFYIIPIALGILTLINIKCICGLEFINILKATEGLSYIECYDNYTSNLTSTSTILAIFTTLFLLLSTWESYYISGQNMTVAMLIIPAYYLGSRELFASVDWVILIMSLIALPKAIKDLFTPSGFDWWIHEYEGKISKENETKIMVDRAGFIFLTLVMFVLTVVIRFFYNDEANFTLP